MALVTRSLPNLFGGVSQQPAAIRLESAMESVKNSIPSLVSGNQQRPGTTVIAKLGAADSASVKGHSYKDPVSGKTFFILAGNQTLKVFDDAGNEKTITGSAAVSYMTSSAPSDDFQMATIGDATFILNKTITPAATSITEASPRIDPTDRWTIFVKEAIAYAYYTIFINGSQQANFAASSQAGFGTGNILTELYNDLNPNYTITKYGSCLSLEVPSGHLVEVYDEGRAGESLAAINYDISKFSDAPTDEEVGRILRVNANPDGEGSDYYIQLSSTKQWVETYGYGDGRSLTNTTMPYKLLYDQGTDTFTFGTHTWDDMVVGDGDTSLDPTFVGNTIKDMFVHKGRLGLLTDENLVMSEVNDYSNFWRTTVIQLLDSDPIDLAAVSGAVTKLNHAVPYNKSLLLFSDSAQYSLGTKSGLLSPKTAGLDYSTAFSASKNIAPINLGSYVYFLDDTAEYARLYEYFIQNDGTTDAADDVSVQIPEYIPTPVVALDGSSSLGMIAVQGATLDALYMYRFFLGTQSKIMSSWNTWDFDGDIKYFKFHDRDLFLFLNYSDGLYLEKIDIEERSTRTELDFIVDMDHLITLSDCASISYSSVTELTTFTTPYAYPSNVTMVLDESDKGIEYLMTNTSGNIYTVVGDVTSYTNASIGIPYDHSFTLSSFYLREQQTDGIGPILAGRVSVRYVDLAYHDTANFDVVVALGGSRNYTYEFQGRVLGDDENILGQVVFASGTFRFPVMGKNTDSIITISNTSPYHSAFQALEWTAQWRPKSKNRR